MLNSNTSVLDRRVTITDDHQTFPYEAGWALEATWFVQTEGDHPALSLRPQTSPDGLAWVDIGPAVELGVDTMISRIPATHFGGWLRLVVEGATATSPATVLTHLVLKG
ncbi:hypothetical protein [Microlunatus soli]|uniref:Uncharacterized protein n=1 Tax=Microlunatus soli TaxID=630515 RepID=A0A1H1TBJ4_9ACTN|nr:hypothetical protein [Microlunatus soli]SDS57366.1 hypothetical protein SAMN04489812_2324 [Microlunatus soli]